MWQAVFIVGSLLVGQTPAVPSGELAGQVARLIRQLDDDRPAIRQAAEASLMQLGPDVLELLPATDAVTSAEVRERLTCIRGHLQHEQARRSVEASLVSLDGEMTVADALRAIQQQTGNTLLGYEDFDQRVTVRMSQVPFWEALDQVLDEGQLTIDPFAGEHRGLMVSRAPSGPAAPGTASPPSGRISFRADDGLCGSRSAGSGPGRDACPRIDRLGATYHTHSPFAATRQTRGA